jgi:hypothetical protein
MMLCWFTVNRTDLPAINVTNVLNQFEKQLILVNNVGM